MTTPAEQCCACGSSDLVTFFEEHRTPVLVCVLWPAAEGARECPKGDVRLTFCRQCGMIENQLFDPALVEYTESYENSLGFSELFQGYMRDLAQATVERHDLHGKRVVEIGSGDGEFLELLCELGENRGVGFDPTYSSDSPETIADGRVRFVRDYYTPEYAHVEADLVACRQVLEHVPDPVGLLRSVRRTLGERLDTAVVFDVPNVLHTLDQLSPWEIFYEHCLYFSPGSLARLFAATGYDVDWISETYNRQFVSVHARPSAATQGAIDAPIEGLAELEGLLERFGSEHRERIDRWRAELASLKAAGKRVVIWGTGARGVTFLNLADPDGTIEYGIDINPRKRGMHVPGGGQRIEAPEFLRELRPDLVVVINPIYTEEIAASLAEMGLKPELRPA